MSDQPQGPQAVERYMPVWVNDSTMRTVAYMEPSPYGLYVRLDAYEELRKALSECIRSGAAYPLTYREVDAVIAYWIKSVEAK